jgi:hypothetical protein
MTYAKLAILMLPALYLAVAVVCWDLAWLTPTVAKEIVRVLALLSLAPIVGVLLVGVGMSMYWLLDKVFDE